MTLNAARHTRLSLILSTKGTLERRLFPNQVGGFGNFSVVFRSLLKQKLKCLAKVRSATYRELQGNIEHHQAQTLLYYTIGRKNWMWAH